MAREFYVDTSELDKVRKEIAHMAEKNIAKAEIWAVNRTVKQAKTFSKKSFAQTIALRAGQIAELIHTRPMTSSKMYGLVIYRADPLSVALFRFVQTKKGIRAKIAKKKKQYRYIPGGFKAKIRWKHKLDRHITVQAFIRSTKKRSPIHKLFGPSIASMALNDMTAIMVYTANRLAVNFLGKLKAFKK